MRPLAGESSRDAVAYIHIIEQTPDRVHFRFKSDILIGLAILAGSLLLLVFLCDSIVVRCQRTADGGVNARVSYELFGCRLHSQSVSNLQGAEIQVNRNNSRDSEGSLYRILLTTANGSVPLTHGYGTGLSRHEKTVEAINQFVANTARQQTILIQRPSVLACIAFGFLFLIGLALALKKSDEVVLDKQANSLRIFRRVFGPPRRLEYDLRDVAQFGVLRSIGNIHETPSDRPSFIFGVGMRLTSGALVYLQNSLSNLGYKKKRAVACLLEDYRRPPESPSTWSTAVWPPSTPRLGIVPRKTCAICGQNCAEDARYQDVQGRYFHQACYDGPDRKSEAAQSDS